MGNKKCKVVVRVRAIRGHCPIFTKGDTFSIEKGFSLKAGEKSVLCDHAFVNILHWILPLSRGVSLYSLGLTTEPAGDTAYLQCADPGEPYTNGGTVTFELQIQDEFE